MIKCIVLLGMIDRVGVIDCIGVLWSAVPLRMIDSIGMIDRIGVLRITVPLRMIECVVLLGMIDCVSVVDSIGIIDCVGVLWSAVPLRMIEIIVVVDSIGIIDCIGVLWSAVPLSVVDHGGSLRIAAVPPGMTVCGIIVIHISKSVVVVIYRYVCGNPDVIIVHAGMVTPVVMIIAPRRAVEIGEIPIIVAYIVIPPVTVSVMPPIPDRHCRKEVDDGILCVNYRNRIVYRHIDHIGIGGNYLDNAIFLVNLLIII
jgi:hypothetical protein